MIFDKTFQDMIIYGTGAMFAGEHRRYEAVFGDESMGVRENKVENYLDEEIVKLGGITRKWTSVNQVGVPDRIVIVNGEVWFVEVKTTDGKLSPGQKREHIRLIGAGANVAVVKGRNGVDEFIKKLMKGNNHENTNR